MSHAAALPKAESWPPAPAAARPMSLRLRVSLVLTAFAAALVLAGAALWLRDARTAIAEEIISAHRVAAQWLGAAANGAASGDPAWSEPRLIAHLHAVGRIRAHHLEVHDESGRQLYQSPPSAYKAGHDAPAWFARGFDPALPPLNLIAGPLTITLQPDASRAIVNLWDDLAAAAGRAALALAGLFAGCWFALGRALRPLDSVMAALDRTGQGRFDTRLPETGPAELVRLAQAFNGMAGRLDLAVAENVRLTQEQALARTVTERLEADRQAIARELHDELGQSITAVGALAGAIIQRCPDNPAVGQSAGVIRDVAARMHDDVRALLTRLRPPSAPVGGQTLADAVASYLDAWQSRHPDIELTTELFAGPCPLPDDITLTALRVVQESCTNVIRHAEATRARVRLLRDDAGLVVEISDNGRGLSPAPGQAGFGLTGMRERVAAVGGKLDITSPAGTGTRVHARLPLPSTDIYPEPVAS